MEELSEVGRYSAKKRKGKGGRRGLYTCISRLFKNLKKSNFLLVVESSAIRTKMQCHLLLLLCVVQLAHLATAADLVILIESDDLEGVIEHVDKNGLDIRDFSNRQTPLMQAALSGKGRIVKALLEKGANPSIGDLEGYTPMHGAAFRGRASSLQALIDAGLDPNEFHKDGYAPIHRACWSRLKSGVEAVRVLVEVGGVDINTPSRAGSSYEGGGLKQHSGGETCAGMTNNEATLEYIASLDGLAPPLREISAEL
jgi:hypothetical protein